MTQLTQMHPTMPVKSNRESDIDAARAIALLCVIAGHAVTSDTTIFRFIFGFHMPFFFLASGLFFRYNDGISIGTFARKKAKSLLIPYVIFSILGLIIIQLFPSWRTGNDLTWYLTRYMYIAQPAALGQSWFLVCLFFTLMIVFAIYRLGIIRKNPSLTLTMISLAFIGTVFIPLIHIDTFGRLPWKIDSAITASVFVLLGVLIRNIGLRNRLKLWHRVVGLVVLPILVFLFAVKLNGYVNICDYVYSNPVYYFIAAIAGSLWLLDIGSFLKDCRLLCRIGQNSLYIFGIHSFVLWAWIRVYCKVFHVETEYLTNPIGVAVISVLTLISCMIATEVFLWVMKKIRKAFMLS